MTGNNATRPRRFYGWKPDRPDHRDRIFAPLAGLAVLPAAVDLRAHCPPVMDQGALGACTAHGITGALRYDRIAQGLGDVELARLQLYYDERELEGTVSSDAGAEIRDGIKCANANGVGPEADWPYDIARFRQRPPAKCYADAKSNRALLYERVPPLVHSIKAALASGFPVVIGITVFASFEGEGPATTGIIPMPAHNEQPVGGHCMYAAGYGQKPGTFTVRNSWGPGWGDQGNCYLPETYLGSGRYGSDYWVVRSVGR